MGSIVPMSIGKRLKEERERLGLNQTEFGEIGGAGRKTQFNYETDERIPDANYLERLYKAGVDVGYVITGVRGGEVLPSYTKDEVDLINKWRKASADARAVALRVLRS